MDKNTHSDVVAQDNDAVVNAEQSAPDVEMSDEEFDRRCLEISSFITEYLDNYKGSTPQIIGFALAGVLASVSMSMSHRHEFFSATFSVAAGMLKYMLVKENQDLENTTLQQLKNSETPVGNEGAV